MDPDRWERSLIHWVRETPDGRPAGASDDVAGDPAMKGAVAFLVSVDIEKTVRVNITPQESQINAIERRAGEVGMTREDWLSASHDCGPPYQQRVHRVSRRLGGTEWAKEIPVVLDNLSAHKTKDVGHFLAEHRHVRFHFTPVVLR